jgi:group I intron endonuclease
MALVGIYKITSPSNKVYIGQSVNILNRKASYKRQDCKKQAKLYMSLLKYGFDKHSFDILCLCDKSELNEKEKSYILEYDSFLNGLNLTSGGESCNVRSDETRMKMSLAQKRNTKSKGHKHTEESKKLMSENRKGKVISETGRKNMSLVQIGKKMSDETKQKISDKLKGKKKSKEQILKFSKSMIGNTNRLGKKKTLEERLKISKSKMGSIIPLEVRNKISLTLKNKYHGISS